MTGAATEGREWRVQWVPSVGRWARWELGLGSVTTHSLPPHSLPRKGAWFRAARWLGRHSRGRNRARSAAIGEPEPSRPGASNCGHPSAGRVWGARGARRGSRGGQLPAFRLPLGWDLVGQGVGAGRAGGRLEPSESSCPYLAGAACNLRGSSAHTEHRAGSAPRRRQEVLHFRSGSLLRASPNDPTWRRALVGSVTWNSRGRKFSGPSQSFPFRTSIIHLTLPAQFGNLHRFWRCEKTWISKVFCFVFFFCLFTLNYFGGDVRRWYMGKEVVSLLDLSSLSTPRPWLSRLCQGLFQCQLCSNSKPI